MSKPSRRLIWILLLVCHYSGRLLGQDADVTGKITDAAVSSIAEFKDASARIQCFVSIASEAKNVSIRERFVQHAQSELGSLSDRQLSQLHLGKTPELLTPALAKCKMAQTRRTVQQNFLLSRRDPWSEETRVILDDAKDLDRRKWILKVVATTPESTAPLGVRLAYVKSHVQDALRRTNAKHLDQFDFFAVLNAVRPELDVHGDEVCRFLQDTLSPYDAVQGYTLFLRHQMTKPAKASIVASAANVLPDVIKSLSEIRSANVYGIDPGSVCNELLAQMAIVRPVLTVRVIDRSVIPAIHAGQMSLRSVAPSVALGIDALWDRMDQIKDARTTYYYDDPSDFIQDPPARILGQAFRISPKTVREWINTTDNIPLRNDCFIRFFATSGELRSENVQRWIGVVDAIEDEWRKLYLMRELREILVAEGQPVPTNLRVVPFQSSDALSAAFAQLDRNDRMGSINEAEFWDRLRATEPRFQTSFLSRESKNLESRASAKDAHRVLDIVEHCKLGDAEKMAYLKRVAKLIPNDGRVSTRAASMAAVIDLKWALQQIWKTLPNPRAEIGYANFCATDEFPYPHAKNAFAACRALGLTTHFDRHTKPQYLEQHDVPDILKSFVESVPDNDRQPLQIARAYILLDQKRNLEASDAAMRIQNLQQRVAVLKKILSVSQ